VVSPQFPLGRASSTSSFGQKLLVSQEKEKMDSRAFLSDYLKGRGWSSGIHPNLHPFAPKRTSHDVTEERGDQARRGEAIESGGSEAM
jgi:hypothetical protein